MKRHLRKMIIVLSSWLVPGSVFGGQMTTIRGIAQETKDGIYVNGVLIQEEFLPPGQTVAKIAGKKIEVKGILEIHREEPLPSGPPGPVVQQRAGPYEFMTKVESIRIK